MTLIEAIKSGKRFRRSDTLWLDVLQNAIVMTNFPDKPRFKFDINDIIADDWEIEEEKIEITKIEAEKALRGLRLNILETEMIFVTDILRRLGFK